MKRVALVFSFFLLVSLACSAVAVPTVSAPATLTPGPTVTPPEVGPIPMLVGYGYRGPFYEVYFCDPFNREGLKEEGGPDLPLVRAMDEARISIDLAAYSLSLYSVRSALLRAFNRGVQVRLVMEADNMFSSVPQKLIDVGIPVVGDEREGLMHDKFVVIDRSEVWLGSMNFTTSGTYEDNNNLIHIRSAQVAENYTVEFEEMFKEDFFGPDAVAATPNRIVHEAGIPMETYFSPDDGIAAHIAELLRGAQKSIYFMAYSFTADDFADIILRKAEDGLKVAGVMEEDQVASNKGTEFDRFQQADLKVYIDGNAGQMHHKVFIIDEEIVITGSYNFSSSAERTNDENVMIFFDPQLAKQYFDEFQRVYLAAQK